MFNRINFNLFLRKDQLSKSGEYKIYLYINVDGNKIYLSTGKNVPEKFWSENDQKVKNGYKDTTAINQKILLIKQNISQLILNADSMGKKLDREDFKIVLRNPIKHDDFIDYISKKIEKELEQREIEKTTKQVYFTLINKLKSFNTSIPFSKVDVYLWRKLEKKLVAEKQSSETIRKILVQFKSFINRAIEDGMLTINPLKAIRIKREVTRREYLTISELMKLEKIWIKTCDETQKRLLGAFLFGCFTGLRISDIKKLQQINIVEGYILLKTTKTKTNENFPINARANKVLLSLDPAKNLLFPSLHDVNFHLKKYMKEAKIEKKITFHCSRHTFATIALILSGNIATVSKLLGHGSIATTQIYANIVDESKMDVSRLFDNMEKKPRGFSRALQKK